VFDNYVALGSNCETAFQIKRVVGAEPSGFFSWNITTFPALISLLESDFAGIMQNGNITAHGNGYLALDSSHNYMFHHRFDWETEPLDGPEFATKLDDVRGKFQYFVEKFKGLPESGKTAFFYKTDEDGDVRHQAIRVRDALNRHFPSDSFELVVLQDASRTEASWEEAGLHNLYLTRLAPLHDAADGHVSSWDRVFAQFPYKTPLRFAGY
jgi:hypothetical protein